MKQILLMIAVVALVGCGTTSWVSDPTDPNNVIIEAAIRKALNKPTGELTKADLAKVAYLFLHDTKITDAGLKDVAELQNLIRLDLQNTGIADAGLKEIAKLQNLNTLLLYGTKITDAGLKEIAKLQKLKNLNLTGTKITDAGLKEIAKMQNLNTLFLHDTKITDEGAAELKKALPKCKIFRNGVKKRKANEYEMAIFGQSATTGVQLTVQIEVPRDSNRSVWIDAEPLFWVTDGLQRAELVVDKQGNEILRLWLTTAGSRQFKGITSRYLQRNLFFLYPLPDPMQKGKFKACCVGAYRVDKVAAVQVLDVIPDASPEELKFIVEELNLKVRAK